MERIRENCVFKLYKSGGRVRLVLRLSLPKIDGDTEIERDFNSYYTSLISDAVSIVESCFNAKDDMPYDGAEYLALDVSFKKEEWGERIIIRRRYALRQGAKMLSERVVKDVFSKGLVLVKNPKNVIKQRNIPSRNAKNIIRRDK